MVNIFNIKGEVQGSMNMPVQFSESYRPDLIKKAVLALQSHKIQKTMSKKGAGNVHSAEVSKRRREYRGTYGIGQSRTPRKVMNRKGSRFSMHGANVPQSVGGRTAHPSVAEKIVAEKINSKERQKAIRSAISATGIRKLVEARGHKVNSLKEFPVIAKEEIEDLTKAKEIKALMDVLGLKSEMERTKQKKIRAGKGKVRGRPYKKRVGPLFVVSKKCGLLNAAKNISGSDVVQVKDLNAELLAPGAQAGRLVIWSEAAISKMDEKKMFM
ncbi:MAG TPA: 50S ribosomal protein L4 [Candidatus Woesearchaeota archaeon]|nr:50S ribosomal protein L4 [Candidatus Woesearchaeota archaeon]